MATTIRDTCRYCGSTALCTLPCDPALGIPHYARTHCTACGRHLQWEPTPMTLERARAFVMPFGKHRGKVLAEVPEDYLRWILDNGVGNNALQRAARCLLGG